MGGRFHPARGCHVAATFSADERELLEVLAVQLAALVKPDDASGPDSEDPLAQLVGLDGGASTPKPPEDAALARLLPDGYSDDAEGAAEFRRYTERRLREGKRGDALTVVESLSAGAEQAGSGRRRAQVRLDADQAQAWLRHLNDVRLVLGEQLGLGGTGEDGADAEDPEALLERLTPEDPRFGVLVVYDWLTAVQGTLVEALWSREGHPSSDR